MWLWAVAREVPFLVTIETLSREVSLVIRPLHGLGHISPGRSSSKLSCSIHVHRNRDIIVTLRSVRGVVRGLVGRVGLVLPWSPDEVVRPWAVVLVLIPNWWGRSSEYCVETSCPVYHDTGGVSYLLPGIGVWNSAVYFSHDEFP